jgi:histidine triad (HIT) family protein
MGCRTARGECAPDEVYRDDHVVVVVAQHAINPGHLVVVSLEHVRNALTMDEELLWRMTLAARRASIRLREVFPEVGIMLLFNNEAPCQTLFHAHLHVVPRTAGDELDHTFGQPVSPLERAAIARTLAAGNKGCLESKARPCLFDSGAPVG